MIRRQLPAYSPQSPRLIWRAAWAAVRSGDEARAQLRDYLRRRFEADDAILTGSGTQALQLALKAAGAMRGATALVALPAYSCYDLVTAAVGAEARVVFYDLDPTHLTPDPDSLRAALGQGANIVVAAPLFGFPLDWTWLRQECEGAGAILVEDSAQGLGSRWNGREGGSFGDLTVLSFGRGKGWTGGSGGALLLRPTGSWSRDTCRVESGRSPPRLASGVRDWLLSTTMWLFGRPALFGIPASIPAFHLGETHYHAPENVTIQTAFAAASTLQHAALARQAIGIRQGWGEAWTRAFEDRVQRGPELCRPHSGGESGYLRLPILARDRAHAAALLREGGGLGVGPGYPLTLPELPAAGSIHWPDDVRSSPGARILAERLITLPTHPRTTHRDVVAVCRML